MKWSCSCLIIYYHCFETNVIPVTFLCKTLFKYHIVMVREMEFYFFELTVILMPVTTRHFVVFHDVSLVLIYLTYIFFWLNHVCFINLHLYHILSKLTKFCFKILLNSCSFQVISVCYFKGQSDLWIPCGLTIFYREHSFCVENK